MNLKEASEIKSLITSLLISNPLMSTIKQLTTDFETMEGRPIPYKQFGFCNIEEYLRSIPDTVVIHGTGPFAKVEVVVTQRSEHINIMVLKQKNKRIPNRIPTWKKPLCSRRVASKCLKQNRGSPDVMSVKVNTLLPSNERRNTHSIHPISQSNWNYCEHEKTESSFGIKITDETTKCMGCYLPQFEPNSDTKYAGGSVIENRSEQPKFDTREESTGNKELQTRLEVQTRSGTNKKFIDWHDHKSGIPAKVLQNLQQLIKEHPDGIACTQLPFEYRKMFKKRLCFEEYSYRSLIEMCANLPEIFHYVQESCDDYILYDSTKLIPPRNKIKMPEINQLQIENIATKHILEELPNLDWSSSSAFIPQDVLGVSDEICKYFPSDLVVGDIIDVSIGEIYDLSKFWMYKTFGELDQLMKNLQTFFGEHHNHYLIPRLLLKEGLYCVALFAGRYHRCVIANLLPELADYVRVLFIDYGTVDNISANSVWFLPKKFSNLPCQALRARLCNIYPVYEDQPWSSEAVARFETLITNRVVVAEITRIEEKDHVLEVYLADITDQHKIFYINDVLVKEGLALYADEERKRTPRNPDCMPIVAYIHLYPEFCEIESGQAPTTDEMKYITENNISQHQYLSQYFHICYEEDTVHIQNQHKQFNQKWMEIIENTSFPEEPDFDLSLFPDSLLNRMKKLVDDNLQAQSKFQNTIHIESLGDDTNFEKHSNNADSKLKESRTDTVDVTAFESNRRNNPESYKEYSFLKKRCSKLLTQNYTDDKNESSTYDASKVVHVDNFKIDKSNSDSNCDINSLDPFSSKSLSDVSVNLEQSQDIISLNNSLQPLNLNNSDISLNNGNRTLNHNMNPFLNDQFLNNTNPFKVTNPFISNLEETVKTGGFFEVFGKKSEEKLPQKFFNNLTECHPQPHKMKKEVNIDRSNLLNNLGSQHCQSGLNSLNSTCTLNPFHTLENKEVKSATDIRRVRTPPGFRSLNVQNRTPFIRNSGRMSYNYMPNSFPSPPCYQSLQLPRHNSFIEQNQFNLSLTQPILGGFFNNYAPPCFLHRHSFSPSMWQEVFLRQNQHIQPRYGSPTNK